MAALPGNGSRAAGGASGAPGDARESLLYRDERRSLGPLATWRLLVRSWPFISKHRRLVAIKCVLAFTSLVFFLLTPWPLKIVIDNVIDGRALTGLPARILVPLAGQSRPELLLIVSLFLFAAAVLIGMVGDREVDLGTAVQSGGLDQAGFTANDASEGWSLWNGIFGYYETRVTIALTQEINQGVRTAIYERFLRSPLGLFADQKIGDAVFRVMHDSAAIGAVLYLGVLAPALSVVAFALGLVILWAQFSSEPLIPELALVALPTVAIVSGLFGRLLRTQSQEMRERGSDVMAAFEERLAQVQLIKAFGREQRETAHIDAASWSSYRSTLKMLAIVLVLLLVVTPLVGLLVVIVFRSLMTQVIRGQMTLGDVVLLFSYSALLFRPMSVIGGTWASLQGPVAGLRRMHSVLDSFAEPGPGGAGTGARLGPIKELEFRDVSLGYAPAAPVVEHVSLALRPGEMIALAGPSGVGKSTLICSLLRFIEPVAGAVLINGTDARKLAPATIREHVGFVFQQEALFSASIADNIRYGKPAATDAEVREAVRMAGAAEFIEQLPDGYATMLGRRGARLSVGQKQRIAIARALVRRPEVLILDEPTAPLDPATESGLISTLTSLARSRIVLIVAHRAETLAACDRVYFIDGGTVAASGTHTQLLESYPPYASYLAVTGSEIHA
jgi:ATP-binding cassette, subfamily B, bacterial